MRSKRCEGYCVILLVFSLWAGHCVFASEINNGKDALIAQADVAYNEGRFADSVKAYKKLAAQGVIEGYLNLAVLLKDLGRYSEASDVIKKAFLEHSGDRRILPLLGKVMFLDGRSDEAIKAYKNILNKYPNDVQALLFAGLCFKDKNYLQEAKRYLNQVVELDKNNIIARIALAEIYFTEDLFKESANEYNIAYSIDPSLVSVQKKLGDIYFRSGNLEQALKIYRKLKAIDPEDKKTLNRLTVISNFLGKAYFDNEKKMLTIARKERTVLVKPFPAAKDEPIVKVKLISAAEVVEFKCSAPFEVKTRNNGTHVFNGIAGQHYFLSRNKKDETVIKSDKENKILANEPVLVDLTEPEGTITLFDVKFGSNNFWSGQSDRSYRGALEITVRDNGLQVVNVVKLEEYVCSVLPSEMLATWPAEALKAQAVAARTEAIYKLGRHKKEGFDFCPEVHCQAYNGVEQETDATNAAANATRGVVMFYSGKPIDAIYSSNCGGHTQDNIFADGKRIPYWKGKPDVLADSKLKTPFSPLGLEEWLKYPPVDILCNTEVSRRNNNFRWVRVYSPEEMNGMISKCFDVGEVRKLTVIKRNKSGHVAALKITGTRREQVIGKELNIRNALGNLRSSMFSVEVKNDELDQPQLFLFYGGGWGHGVGMCQTGAFTMAAKGKDYKSILRHYFNDIEFNKLYQ